MASVAQQAEVAVHARQAAEASGREGVCRGVGESRSVVLTLLGPRVVGCLGYFFSGMKYENPIIYRDRFINHDIKDAWIPKVLSNE